MRITESHIHNCNKRPMQYLKSKCERMICEQSKIMFYIYRFVPCPFTGPKMFWAGPNFLCQNKKLFTYCGSHKNFVPDKKMICIQ